MKLSLCVIAKNEEKYIERCLNSVRSVVTEMIVVDTGSTDKTIEIAEKLGAKVYHFEWVDDFAKARNFALSKAKGDWIIFLDADEYVSEDSLVRIPSIIKKAAKRKYDAILGYLLNYEKDGFIMMDSTRLVRIFRRDPKIFYTGAIHEYLTTANKGGLNYLDASNEIKILHTGYSREDKLEKDKANRNLKLLFKELEKDPTNGLLYYYIAEAYALDRNYNKALEYSIHAQSHSKSLPATLKAKNYKNKISYMILLKYPDLEIIQAIKEAIQNHPDYSDLYYLLGNKYLQTGRMFDTINSYEQALKYVEVSNKYQSSMFDNILTVQKQLAKLYNNTDQLHKSVQYFIELLKSDRYDLDSIRHLLRILIKFENIQDIMNLLGKIYDFKNAKDILILLQAAFHIGNYDLSKSIFSLFNELQQTRLQFENTFIHYLNREFGYCAEKFKALYQKIRDKETAIYYIISADLADKKESIGDEFVHFDESLQRAVKKLFYNPSEELSDQDFSELMNLLSQYIKLGYINKVFEYLHVVPQKYLLHVADSFYNYEQYESALEMYNQYTENENGLPAYQLHQILVRMGECLFKLAQFELSLEFFKDAIKIVPDQYKPYEMGILVCEKLGDQQNMKDIVVGGLRFFPDSEFLHSKLKLFPYIKIEEGYNVKNNRADLEKTDFFPPTNLTFSKNKVKNILYLGWLGKGNVGDEVLFELFKLLFYRYHNSNHEYAVNIDPVQLTDNYKYDISYYDLIVLGGGSLLHLPYYLKICQNAIEQNIPVVTWGTGIDGFYKKDSLYTISLSQQIRTQFKEVYENIGYLSVRGPFTQNALRNIGVVNEIHEIGDPALIYSDETFGKKRGFDNKNNKNILINWGTSYNNVFGKNELEVEQEVVIVAKALIAKGYHLTIYPIWTEDIEPVKRLGQKINEKNCSIITQVCEAKILQQLINQSYMTINLKLHANILSAAGNVPFISLAYRGKCFDFAQTVQCSEYAVATDQVTSAKILKLVEDIEKNYDKIIERFEEAKKKYYPKLVRSIQIISDYLNKPTNNNDHNDHDETFQRKCFQLLEIISNVEIQNNFTFSEILDKFMRKEVNGQNKEYLETLCQILNQYVEGKVSDKVMYFYLEKQLCVEKEKINTVLQKLNLFGKGTSGNKEIKEMVENAPKVSVIITTYNRKDYLKQAIESILVQDYPNIEIIVMDDCSTDGTDIMMRECFIRESSVIYVRNDMNRGPGINRRYAFEDYANGDYILFLDDDDYLVDAGYITKAVIFHRDHPEISFVAANVFLEYPKKNLLKLSIINLNQIINKYDYFINFGTNEYPKPVSTLTAVFKRKSLIEMGILNMEMVNDASIYLRALLVGDAGFIDHIVGVYRIHGENITFHLTSDFIIKNLDEKLRIKKLAVEQYGYDARKMEQWMKFNAYGTLLYFLENSANKTEDVKTMFSWLERNCPDLVGELRRQLNLDAVKPA